MSTTINYIARTGNPATIIRETVARGVLIATFQGPPISICKGYDLSEADTKTIKDAVEDLSFYNDCIAAYCRLEDGTNISIERDN